MESLHILLFNLYLLWVIMSVSDTALSADIRNLEVQDNSASAFNTPTSGTPIPTTSVSSQTTALLDKVVKILKDPVSTNRNRMYEHQNSVQKFQPEKSTPVSRHFTQKNHSVKNMEFSIFQWMGDPTSPNATSRRRSQELYYIWAFPTLHPTGTNMFV